MKSELWAVLVIVPVGALYFTLLHDALVSARTRSECQGVTETTRSVESKLFSMTTANSVLKNSEDTADMGKELTTDMPQDYTTITMVMPDALGADSGVDITMVTPEGHTKDSGVDVEDDQLTMTDTSDSLADVKGHELNRVDDVSMNIPDRTVTSEQRPDSKNDDKPQQRMNVLFLMADDMRPLLGAYIGNSFPNLANQSRLLTPNFDRLARDSLVFKNAYVQYSLCGPSRTSILTGRRPDTTRIFGNMHYWRTTGGNFTTLPQYFKQQGYLSLAAGKIFHPSVRSSNDSDPMSWSEPSFGRYWDGKFEDDSRLPSWNSITEEEREGTMLTDEYALEHIVETLNTHADKARTGEQPIFIALGFRKPHISLNCPQKHFDLIPEETAEQYLIDPSWQNPAVGFPMVNSTVDESGVHHIPDPDLRKLRRAYFACISYIDELLGQVLDAVVDLGLSDNTVISFMADHGYHLGDNNHWGKYITTEVANRVPMMLKVPGRTEGGRETSSLVEAIDVFPTIVEAAGLEPVPGCPDGSSAVQLCTEGTSLMPLVDNPAHIVRNSAISQLLKNDRFMQYSLRTDRYRYTAYTLMERQQNQDGLFTVTMNWQVPELDGLNELYDHLIDPDERFNKIEDPDYSSVIDVLAKELRNRVKPVHNVPVASP